MQIPSVTEIAPHLGSHRYKFCWECVCLCVSVCVCVCVSVLPLAAVARYFSAVCSFPFGSFALFFYHSIISRFHLCFFLLFFLALLKLTTLSAIAIACPILWHLSPSCPVSRFFTRSCFLASQTEIVHI